MKLRIHDRNLARKMRREGASYHEIIRFLSTPVAKSTLTNWLKGINLTSEQRQRLIKKMQMSGSTGRQRGAFVNHQLRLERLMRTSEEANKIFPIHIKHPLFAVGLVLYWAEGSKTQEHFQFMNSDPRLIQLMLKWLQEVCKVPVGKISLRLYIHPAYIKEKPEKFWLELTQLPKERLKKTVIKPSYHTEKKNQNYHGCCRIEVTGVQFFHQIQIWQNELFKYLTMPS